MDRCWHPDHYRTYREEPGQPAGSLSVRQEVTRALARPKDFLDTADRAQARGRARDRLVDARPAFVVERGNHVSARWPGDVHTFTKTFAARV